MRYAIFNDMNFKKRWESNWRNPRLLVSSRWPRRLLIVVKVYVVTSCLFIMQLTGRLLLNDKISNDFNFLSVVYRGSFGFKRYRKFTIGGYRGPRHGMMSLRHILTQRLDWATAHLYAAADAHEAMGCGQKSFIIFVMWRWHQLLFDSLSKGRSSRVYVG